MFTGSLKLVMPRERKEGLLMYSRAFWRVEDGMVFAISLCWM